MTIIETALGQPFVRQAGTDLYIRYGPISVYISGHEFGDGDIDGPGGLPIPLRTEFPHLADPRRGTGGRPPDECGRSHLRSDQGRRAAQGSLGR
jgi:hypothetical protein